MKLITRHDSNIITRHLFPAPSLSKWLGQPFIDAATGVGGAADNYDKLLTAKANYCCLRMFSSILLKERQTAPNCIQETYFILFFFLTWSWCPAHGEDVPFSFSTEQGAHTHSHPVRYLCFPALFCRTLSQTFESPSLSHLESFCFPTTISSACSSP